MFLLSPNLFEVAEIHSQTPEYTGLPVFAAHAVGRYIILADL